MKGCGSFISIASFLFHIVGYISDDSRDGLAHSTPLRYNIKTTDKWSQWQLSSHYNSMVCRETLGPGIHEDVTLACTSHLKNYCRPCTPPNSNATPAAGIRNELRMFLNQIGSSNNKLNCEIHTSTFYDKTDLNWTLGWLKNVTCFRAASETTLGYGFSWILTDLWQGLLQIPMIIQYESKGFVITWKVLRVYSCTVTPDRLIHLPRGTSPACSQGCHYFKSSITVHSVHCHG